MVGGDTGNNGLAAVQMEKNGRRQPRVPMGVGGGGGEVTQPGGQPRRWPLLPPSHPLGRRGGWGGGCEGRPSRSGDP